MARSSGSQLSLTYFETQAATDKSPPSPESAHVDWKATDKEDVALWQLHRRYIVSEIKSGMVIIDQHVAHERVLFEKILGILKMGNKSYGQKLLFPQKLTLAYDDFMIFKEIYEILKNLGFSITVFSGTTIVIEAMPVDVKVGRESQILLDIVDYYKTNPLNEFDLSEKMAAAYACKNAVKSGEQLSQVEMHNLIDQLFACETPFFCPHGRPVIITITLDELDRKFKRII
jgi:DNA mismatch repair protein MutL